MKNRFVFGILSSYLLTACVQYVPGYKIAGGGDGASADAEASPEDAGSDEESGGDDASCEAPSDDTSAESGDETASEDGSTALTNCEGLSDEEVSSDETATEEGTALTAAKKKSSVSPSPRKAKSEKSNGKVQTNQK